jgi:hypothetical protein
MRRILSYAAFVALFLFSSGFVSAAGMMYTWDDDIGCPADYQGWILQCDVERYYNQTGTKDYYCYPSYMDATWDDATQYPYLPGGDPMLNGRGALKEDLQLLGMWDNTDVSRRWFDATYPQSEDWWIHNSSNPGQPMYCNYPYGGDYGAGGGCWPYGCYPCGWNNEDFYAARVYSPSDKLSGYIYTKSGSGWTYVQSSGVGLKHGWNILKIDASEITGGGGDITDMREIGVKVGSNYPVFNSDLYVDWVQAGATPLPYSRYVYILPDIIYVKVGENYTLDLMYDDGGGQTTKIRGISSTLDFCETCMNYVSAGEGSFLGSFPSTYFDYYIDGSGDLVMDNAILGATSGADGWGQVCYATFNALSECCCDLSLSVIVRDVNNQPIASNTVGGKWIGDGTGPAQPTLTSSTHTPSVWSNNNTVTVNWSSVGDPNVGTCPGSGTYAYFLLLDGNPSSTYDPDDPGVVYVPEGHPLTWTWAGVGDGTWYVHVYAVDNVWNRSTTDDFGPIMIDTQPPGDLSLFTMSPKDNVAPGSGGIEFTYTMPAPGGGSPEGIEIRANLWGGYPTYGADPGHPGMPTLGTQVYKGPSASPHTVSPLARDIYNCAAWVYDDAGNYSAGSLTDRGTSYYLGDFDPDGSSPYAGWDGLVTVLDLTPFSNTYSTSFPPTNVECDIGPTAATNLYAAYHRFAIPVPDSRVNFEDLMIFAMNYQSVPLVNGGGASIASLPVIEPTVRLELIGLQEDEFEARLIVDRAEGIKGAHCVLSFDPSKSEFMEAEKGEIFNGLDVFFDAREEGNRVDMSVAVLSGAVIQNSGEMVRFTFRALAEDPEIRLALVDLRDANNVTVLMEASEDIPLAGPSDFSLAQNAPNPFDARTSIRFAVPRTSEITIQIFDISGRLVRTLVHDSYLPGYHRAEWDALDNHGNLVSPGVYFYKLSSDKQILMRKMIKF